MVLGRVYNKNLVVDSDSFYMYFFLGLMMKLKFLFSYFFLLKDFLIFFRLINHNKKIIFNCLYKSFHILYTMSFMCLNIYRNSTWRNFHCRYSVYSVNSSFMFLVNYSNLQMIDLLKFMNKADDNDLFWEIHDEKKPNMILSKDSEVWSKSFELVNDESLTDFNYYFSERYLEDKKYFYKNIFNLGQETYNNDHIWMALTEIITLGLIGGTLKFYFMGFFLNQTMEWNYYSCYCFSKKSDMCIFLTIDEKLEKKYVSSYGKSQYLVCLVDNLADLDMMDYAVPVSSCSMTISFVFFNMAVEHFLIGQKLSFSILKTSYCISKLNILLKKMMLLNM